MSSVGSSDSSNNNSREQGEVIRKNREQYQNNEADMVKKHRTEIRRINEQHYSEIENLKKDHEKQMNDLRSQTNAEINKRDHKNQSDIEELRGLYRKQIQSQSEDNYRANEALRTANSNDRNTEKTHSENRMRKLNDDYTKGLETKDASYEKALKENRELQQQAIRKNADRLERKYNEQAKSIKDERNLRVGGLQKAYDDYRQNSEARFRDQDLRHFQEQQRASDDMLRAVQKERLSKQDNEEYLRDGFADGMQKQRDRYEKAMRAERESANIAREDFHSDIGSRITNRISRLENEKEDLKDANIRAQTKMKQDKQREVANISDAYQKNLDNYKEQRDEAVAQSNDRNHRDIKMVRKDLEEQATAMNRQYRQIEEQQNQIHRKAYDNLERDNKLRQEQTQSLADRRVQQLYETTTEEKTRLTELQMDNHTASQRAHQDEMRKLRASMENDKNNAVANLQEHMQRQEVAHAERMNVMVSKYEKQIQGMKDEMAKQKKLSDENLRRVTDEMTRQSKLAQDQLVQQNRDRSRQTDTQHAEELRQLNKRNEQKIDQLLTEIKKT